MNVSRKPDSDKMPSPPPKYRRIPHGNCPALKLHAGGGGHWRPAGCKLPQTKPVAPSGPATRVVEILPPVLTQESMRE